MYKYMSEELREKSRHAGLSYFKPQDLPEEVRSYVPPLNYEELIGDRTARSLQDIFKDVLKRKKNRVDPVRSGFGKIRREEISVADKELYVKAYLAAHPHADFRQMLEREDSKEEIIVTFLVILELMKYQKIRITQEEAFGRILIDLVEQDSKAAGEDPPSETDAGEPEEPKPVPSADEAEPDPSPVKKKRILRAGTRKWKIGSEHIRMPITARRMRQQLLRIARGRRLWYRRNMRHVHRFR